MYKYTYIFISFIQNIYIFALWANFVIEKKPEAMKGALSHIKFPVTKLVLMLCLHLLMFLLKT